MTPDSNNTLPLLGTLPEKWTIAEFGSVLLEGTRNGLYKQKQFHGVGAKIVNMGELFANPRLRAIPMKRIDVSRDELGRFGLQVGDLLFARRSLVAKGAGKCSIVCELDEPTVFESSIIRARPNPQMVDAHYLYYLFSSPFGSYALGSILRHVAVAGITGADLRTLTIPLPPLPEQRTIAHILGALEDKIELNRRMNETLEAMACALFKSWFVDFDPVKRNQARNRGETTTSSEASAKEDALFPDSFQDSPLGKIPKEWPVCKVGEVVAINERSITRDYRHRTIEYVEISSVAKGRLLETAAFDLSEAPSRAKRLVLHGDTIWSCVRPNRQSYLYIHNPVPNLVVSTGFAVLTAKKIPASYLYQWLTTDEFVEYLSYSADGSAYPAVRPERFAEAQLLVPSPQILNRFERIVGPMRDRMACNEQESGGLSAIRDALLPKLISGEIQVS